MRPKRVLAIVLRQFYLLRGSMTRIIPLFVWVAIDMVLWGFITKYLNTITAATTNFLPIFLGAMMFWGFLVRVMQGVTMAFMEDTWSRNFLNLFASPLKVSEYICGLVASSIVTSSIGLVVMLVLATAVFGLSLFSYGVLIIPFLLVLFLFGIALGVLGCAVMLRFGPSAEWFVWPIPALISPFACVFYPLSILPAWMHYIAYALPPSYVFESMRAVVNGQPVEWTYICAGAGLAIGYIVLMCWVFIRVHRHAVRTGLIARYSAESVA